MLHPSTEADQHRLRSVAQRLADGEYFTAEAAERTAAVIMESLSRSERGKLRRDAFRKETAEDP